MMGEITEEQLQKVREPIPFTPTKRLERDDVLYVTEEDIPHPIYGYAESHKEYSVIDLRGYRKGYEPRLEISGIYTPNPEDTFRLQTGKLPPYQPTTTGDKLLAEMRRLGVHKAFSIGKPEVEPEEVPAVPEVKLTKNEASFIDTYIPGYEGRTTIPVEEMFHSVIDPLRKLAGQYEVGTTTYINFTKRINALERKATEEAVKAKLAIPIKPPAVEVAKPPIKEVVEYDRRYTLEELKEKARQGGLSPSGSKKEIAARLIAKEVT